MSYIHGGLKLSLQAFRWLTPSGLQLIKPPKASAPAVEAVDKYMFNDIERTWRRINVVYYQSHQLYITATGKVILQYVIFSMWHLYLLNDISS